MASMPDVMINVLTLEGAKLTLTKGDTLVVMSDRHLTKEQYAALSGHLVKVLPEGVGSFILGPGLTLAAITQGA